MFGLGVLVGVFGTALVEICIALLSTIYYEKKGEKNGRN